MTKATRPQMVQMEREIRQLRRAISIRENLGVEHTLHKGVPVPGLSLADWKAKLAHYEECYAKRIPFVVESAFNVGAVQDEDVEVFQHPEGPYHESVF